MGKSTSKRPAELEYTPANCHAREVLARIGDKWSVYVMHVLGDARTLRFNEVRSQVDGISQRMLTVTLRGLERDGLIARKVYPEVPPRVEYRLTPLGATLRQLVRGLVDWSGAHLAEVDAARAAYDVRNRGPALSEPLARPTPPRRGHQSRTAG
ncbi:MAG: helix-turn-helix domain-containing protein [Gemmatimonadaceae bacterium]